MKKNNVLKLIDSIVETLNAQGYNDNNYMFDEWLTSSQIDSIKKIASSITLSDKDINKLCDITNYDKKNIMYYLSIDYIAYMLEGDYIITYNNCYITFKKYISNLLKNR